MQILPYFSSPAEFRPYDPAVKEIVQLLDHCIRTAEPRLQVEHIGSTSIPECAGKGIIDLAILYPDNLLSSARAALDKLGFQKQGGPEPFPEERPMRVGSVEHNGIRYRIHAHVIALNCKEHQELVWFRDRLRNHSAERQRYEERKQAILTMGISDSLEYCKTKGAFITDLLKVR